MTASPQHSPSPKPARHDAARVGAARSAPTPRTTSRGGASPAVRTGLRWVTGWVALGALLACGPHTDTHAQSTRPGVVCPEAVYITQIHTPLDALPTDGALLLDTRRRDGSVTGTLPAVYAHALDDVRPDRLRLVLVGASVRVPLTLERLGGGFTRAAPARRLEPGTYDLEGFGSDALTVQVRGELGPAHAAPRVETFEHGERGRDITRFRTSLTFAEPLPPHTVAVALDPGRREPFVVLDRYGHEPPAWAGTEGSTGGPCLAPAFERQPPRAGLRGRPLAIDAFGRVSPPGPEVRLTTNIELPERYP